MFSSAIPPSIHLENIKKIKGILFNFTLLVHRAEIAGEPDFMKLRSPHTFPILESVITSARGKYNSFPPVRIEPISVAFSIVRRCAAASRRRYIETKMT